MDRGIGADGRGEGMLGNFSAGMWPLSLLNQLDLCYKVDCAQN